MLPVRLRLVSTRVDESWSFPEVVADDRAALQRGLGEAADWLAGQLRAHGRAGLGAIVLDCDGARCGWVSSVSADPDSVGAMLRQAAEPVSDEDAAHAVGSTPQLALGSDTRISGSASYQPLGAEGASAGSRPASAQPRRRFGVAAIPDATVRLLLDELDSRGVETARVVTVWQALSEAFDAPGAQRTDRVVTAPGGTTAQICADPVGGRLLWSWSREGRPVAAGAFRLPRGYPTGEGGSGVRMGASELGRLSSEWIAWSTQLGASPSRVRVLLPEELWQDGAGLGECVSGVWPGATSDIAFDGDPLGTVLARFADGSADPRLPESARGTIESLQSRPGRQHRSMYRWAAVAITIAAGVMGVGAYATHQAAGSARADAAKVRKGWRERGGALMPAINEGAYATAPWDAKALQDLQDQLDALRRAVAPVTAVPEKPILRELETLSLILGNPEYTLEEVNMSSTAVTINVVVPDTAAYEELINALERIGGSSVKSWTPTPTPRANGIRVSLVGLWADAARAPAPGGA